MGPDLRGRCGPCMPLVHMHTRALTRAHTHTHTHCERKGAGVDTGWWEEGLAVGAERGAGREPGSPPVPCPGEPSSPG